ncbi:hypothetical protein HPB51_027684 [Rhipicephalus microplus]|uniref:Uncharacterized protein n=1 Tax=Rhipicephalus microplus TaxID=6941 RepID=A0A9J6CZJ3_RHIMP|nr:hypothetical protein HPB51_027684 [Rhipicephalus microplus]
MLQLFREGQVSFETNRSRSRDLQHRGQPSWADRVREGAAEKVTRGSPPEHQRDDERLVQLECENKEVVDTIASLMTEISERRSGGGQQPIEAITPSTQSTKMAVIEEPEDGKGSPRVVARVRPSGHHARCPCARDRKSTLRRVDNKLPSPRDVVLARWESAVHAPAANKKLRRPSRRAERVAPALLNAENHPRGVDECGRADRASGADNERALPSSTATSSPVDCILRDDSYSARTKRRHRDKKDTKDTSANLQLSLLRRARKYIEETVTM